MAAAWERRARLPRVEGSREASSARASSTPGLLFGISEQVLSQPDRRQSPTQPLQIGSYADRKCTTLRSNRPCWIAKTPPSQCKSVEEVPGLEGYKRLEHRQYLPSAPLQHQGFR